MQRLKTFIAKYFLFFIVLAASWSLFTPQFFRVHDYTHAGRIVEMATALKDGHFPVRWSANFGYGYGMPLFEFYGPLPFYLGAVIYWLTNNVVLSIKLLYLVVNLGTAWGAYLLGKRLYGNNGGLITAAALTLAPYRAVNLFVRGALNEAWAIMFLPWILLGAIDLFHQRKKGWLTFTLGLTGLMLSHNITTMLFMPVLLLFILGYLLTLLLTKAPEFYRSHRFRGLNFLRIMASFVKSGLLAVGLAAFYVVPAFLEKGLTRVEEFILTPYFDYHLHFLYIRQFFIPNWGYGGSSWGVADDISFFLGWGQLLALVLLAAYFFKKLWRWLLKKKSIFNNKPAFPLVITFTLLFLSSLYMSLLKSQWLWDQIPLLKFAQFPWRWLSIAIVFFSLLLGSLSWLVDKKLKRTHLTLIIILAMIIGAAGYFRPAEYLENDSDYYYTDQQLIRTQLSEILPDYISASMPAKPTVIAHQLILNEADLPIDQLTVLANRTQEKLIQTNFTQDTKLSLGVAEYPGWRLEIDNQRWDRQHGANGNLEVVVPPGNHLVSLRFLDTPTRAYADWLSLLCWLVLIMMLLPKKANHD